MDIKLRRTSEVTGQPIPYRNRRTTLLRLSTASLVQAHDVAGKQELLASRQAEDVFLLAWTGNWTTDVFLVDTMDALVEALR